MKPSAKLSKSSVTKFTFVKSGSSSAPDVAPERIQSPKSYAARPGIIVSRSITQSASCESASTKTLLIFVSLCVTRNGKIPASSLSVKACMSSLRANKKSISSLTLAALPTGSASNVFKKVSNLTGVLWKFGIAS